MVKKEQTKKEQIRFKYIFSNEYNPVFSNGVLGGVSFKGEFILHFFQERVPVPKSITHELNADDTLGDEIERDPADHSRLVIRYITTGVTLNYGDAKRVHAWLGENLKRFEKESVTKEYPREMKKSG